ncbi:acyltransferase family protein [Tatumella ptyseos]|uniref:acyltransferase family protein n=1 Tax=Tatumella ptyseos TaxID=82987 RepID=UPI0026F0EDFF|nr:acyltransferase [Tatumella ptyseos]WKX27108.1 acyltransferase [Tatumella ptyseos]
MIIYDKSNLASITALRGISVILVVLYHYSWFVHPLETTFLRRGYIGVDIFFIISGFLACHTTKKLGASPFNAIKYFLQRLARIYPAYLIVTLLYVSVYYFRGFENLSLWSVIKSLCFFPQSSQTGPSYGSPVVEVGWTLNYEFFFT